MRKRNNINIWVRRKRLCQESWKSSCCLVCQFDGLISPAAQQLTVLRVYKTSSDTNRPEAKHTGRRRKSQHGDSLPAVFSCKPAACYSCWSDFTAIWQRWSHCRGMFFFHVILVFACFAIAHNLSINSLFICLLGLPERLLQSGRPCQFSPSRKHWSTVWRGEQYGEGFFLWNAR